MDLLVEADTDAKVQEAVFFAVANLLNLEVDLLFFDTTSTYFERDTEDAPVPDAAPAAAGDGARAGATSDGTGTGSGFRRYGHSKDSRPDLPQIIIGLAVTREGIPVRVWCWPNAVVFTVADAGSLEQSRDTVSRRPFRASSSDTSLRAA